MPDALPEKLNVMVIASAGEAVLQRIQSADPNRINLIDAFADFVPEMSREWPERMMQRNTSHAPPPTRTPEELEALVRSTHVMLLGVPFPAHLLPRASQLRWAHFAFAGTSNLAGTDWWEAPMPITSTRGDIGAEAIAETSVAAAMMYAKRLDIAVTNSNPQFDPTRVPSMMRIAGKTMGIVGLGGIGSNIAKLSRGLGMRVVATRHSATERRQDVDGVDELFPPSQLHSMLEACDFVAICAMWTPETQGMIDAAACAAMKQGAFVINVARGEIIDQRALIDSLQSGHLGGAYLDVWPDDFASPPHPELLVLPNVVFTPHISWHVEARPAFGIDLFCENLEKLLKGEPLRNVVDWRRGY